MANKNNNVNNENNNAQATAQQAPETVQNSAPVVQEQQPVAQPAQQQEEQLPATPPQPAEAEEKPKFWDTKFGKGLKKVGAVLGGIAAIATVAVVAEKVGEANGFDKASDSFNNRVGNDPEEPSSDGNDLGEASITEVSEET